jgi:Fe-S-cluster containining protein
LALDEGLFKSRYLEPSKEKGLDVKSRAEAFNPCVFLEASLCLIEPVKPKVCRSWPFIESVLRSESAFCEAESACPGLKNISYGEMLTEYQERQKRG